MSNQTENSKALSCPAQKPIEEASDKKVTKASNNISREEYINVRNHYDNIHTGQAKLLDSSFLNISSASIGISLIFLKDFDYNKYTFLFWLSIIFFASTMIFTIISIESSQKLHEKKIKYLDNTYENIKDNYPKCEVGTLHVCRYVFFSLGLVSIVIYTFLNELNA